MQRIQSVLAIDDSLDIHKIIAIRLKQEPLVLHHALSPAEGLKKALELPDLILLDVDMPDTSGFDVCRQLKENPITSHIPVIFLTANADTATKVRAFDIGAVDFVIKPFEPAELCARVRAALRTKRYHDLLARTAQIDALTGVWNRSYFDRRIAEEMAAARRFGRTLSLVMMDLDHFKKLNDGYGHPFGDRVLQGVGEAVLGCVRATDAVCRYGGEEFALLLGETPMAGALQVVIRVQERLAALGLTQGGKPVMVSASFGIGSTEILAEAQLTVENLVERADAALYRAKDQGRNRMCLAA